MTPLEGEKDEGKLCCVERSTSLFAQLFSISRLEGKEEGGKEGLIWQIISKLTHRRQLVDRSVSPARSNLNQPACTSGGGADHDLPAALLVMQDRAICLHRPAVAG